MAGAQQHVVEGEGLEEQGADDLWHGQLREKRKWRNSAPLPKGWRVLIA